jgi:predicted molibdopterin-dependent oxidoreductase YjgC
VLTLANLALLTGQIGKRASGVNPLRGQNNVQGACDMGALPNVLPGYQRVNAPELRARFEEAWGCPLPAAPGLTLTEIFDAVAEGRIEAVYLVGENSVLSEADSRHVEEALRRQAFVVAQDIFLSETARFADVVLPAASFAEKDGTFTNTERRVQRVRKAIDPPGEAKPDWWITCQLARRLGGAGFDYRNTSEIMDEIARLAPIYGGISHRRLESGGLQWPCPAEDHPGTPVLHTARFATPDGRARFVPLAYKPPAESADAEYPLVLTTDRSLVHYHTGTMTRRVEGLNALDGEELLRINPDDAQRLGIADGERVEVRSRRGAMRVRARVTGACPPGLVSATFHFAESPTNVLTNPALDPVAKIPETKVCAVRVERVVDEA